MQINLSFALLVVASCSGEQFILKNVASSEGLFAKKNELMNRMLKEEETQTHYIAKGEPKTFFYLLQWNVPWLTITLSPCAIPVAWAVRNISGTGVKVNMSLSGWTPSSFEKTMQVYEERNATQQGFLMAIATSVSGYVQIFVSIAGPLSVLRPTTTLSVNNRRFRGQLAVRWPPSTVDPHMISYWLVVNPTTPLTVMCQAKTMAGLDVNRQSGTAFKVVKGNLTVETLGNRTSVIIKGLKTNQSYFVGIFVVNNFTGLSYLYGNTTVKYTRARPVPLRDGRQMEVNMKKMDGRVTFRYKVAKSTPPNGRLDWFITVCGTGAVVDAEVRFKRKQIIQRREIVGYSTISWEAPIPGATYLLRLNSTEPETLTRISQVQVLASLRGLQEPVLPLITTPCEYKSTRGCRSVQLGWNPSSQSVGTNVNSSLTYCITTKEVSKYEPFTPTPDHCAHALALRNHDYTTNFCFHRPIYKKVIAKEVGHLKPGRFYDMQIAVRLSSSRVLSYEKIRVRTKTHC